MHCSACVSLRCMANCYSVGGVLHSSSMQIWPARRPLVAFTQPHLHPRKAMKRKQPPTAPAGKQPVGKSAASSSRPSSTKFSRPLAPLVSDASDEEEDAAEVAHQRAIMNEIDQDNEDAEEDQDAEEDEDAEMDEGEDDDEAEDDDAEDESAEDDADDAEMADDASASDADSAADAAAAASSSSSAPATPSEFDLPLRLVQSTYSGLLFGLKSNRTPRQIRSGKASKKLDDDDDEDEDEDDEAAALPALPATSYAPISTSPTGLSLLFTTSAHIGSIKCVCVSGDGKWMVSGGVDECIKIFKTSLMIEFGQLFEHRGSVSCMEFYGSEFLLSGGHDGDLIIWQTNQWQAVKKFQAAHRPAEGSASVGGVGAIAVHPSGRVAISVGTRDKTIKLWDLVKGGMASSSQGKYVVHTVKWSNKGDKYALVGDKIIEFFDTSNTILRREEVSDTKILVGVFVSDELFAIGCEDKTIRIHSVSSGECIMTLSNHQARVRGLDVITMPDASSSSSSSSPSFCTFVASASTDGQTHVWDATLLVRAHQPRVKGQASVSAPSALTPVASTMHDHRVTILKFLPHFDARKQSQAKKQQQPHAHKASKGDATTTASDRAAASLHKSKALFERKAREREKVKALLEAKRVEQVGKAARNVENDQAEADAKKQSNAQAIAKHEQQSKSKKAKIDFEIAPLNRPIAAAARAKRDEENDQEADEIPAKPAHKQPAPQPKQQQPKQQQQQQQQQPGKPSKPTQQASSSKPAQPAAVGAKQSRPASASTSSAVSVGQPSQKKHKGAQPAPSAPAAKKPTPAPAAAADSDDDDDDANDGHIGFSASLPLFRPQLAATQRKKKSKQKIARDAERNKKRGGR